VPDQTSLSSLVIPAARADLRALVIMSVSLRLRCLVSPGLVPPALRREVRDRAPWRILPWTRSMRNKS